MKSFVKLQPDLMRKTLQYNDKIEFLCFDIVWQLDQQKSARANWKSFL